MPSFNQSPSFQYEVGNETIYSFITGKSNTNIDWKTVESFGNEWGKFSEFQQEEVSKIGNEYFDIALRHLTKESVALEIGCGSGRWMKFLAPYVKEVHGIDPSDSVFTAVDYLKGLSNKVISKAEVDNIPYEDESFDLVYSLGVLHHIPDTRAAMAQCVKKVKKNGYFLVYLYYSLDNRSSGFRMLFKLSNLVRLIVSKAPFQVKSILCDFLAVLFYMPFVWLSRAVEALPYVNKWVGKIPLSYYRDKSFKIIRNDSLDRFGTPLEQRFSKIEIEKMMRACGLSEIEFSNKEPYWHAIGKKAF